MTTAKIGILMSLVTVVLCVALAAGGTYALFSESVTLVNHLHAGTMDITLTRTNLETVSLDPATGLLVKTNNSEHTDFSLPNARSVFDLTDQTLLVPGSYYCAEMQITNESDVTFGYWLEIVFEDGMALAFADQLKVTVISASGTKQAALKESAGLIGDADAPIGVLGKTESAMFTVSVEFCDLEGVNNAASSQNLHFDLIVHAVQSTTPHAA